LVEAVQFSGTNPGSRDLRGGLPNPFIVALVHDPTRFDASSELEFVVIPTTLLYYANLAATNLNLALAIDTETGTNVYISFPFMVLTDRNLD